jgi:hypothetical protein
MWLFYHCWLQLYSSQQLFIFQRLMETLFLQNSHFFKMRAAFRLSPENVTVNHHDGIGRGAFFLTILVTLVCWILPSENLSAMQSTPKVLSISPGSLTFKHIVGERPPRQTATLSASTGSPAVSLSQSAGSEWLVMPSPALGALGFGVSADGMAVGTYQATVTARASGYTSATLKIMLVVKEPEPTLVLADIGNKTTIIGQEVAFTATAQANRNQVKTFSLVNAPTGATIGGSTGAFKWTPVKTGSFTFTVKVSTNLLTDQEQITIKVLSLNANDKFRINAGGEAYLASGNKQFTADQYFSGIDRTSGITSGNILNTTDDVLYRTGRCSERFDYNIPVRNGKHSVVLHFAETWFGVSGRGPGGTGSRKFGVVIEEDLKLSEYDIYTKAGGALRAIKETIPVTVTDGILNIEFMSGSKDIPRVSAIEVLFVGPADGGRMSEEILAEVFGQQEAQSVVYPNPVRNRFTLEIGGQHDRNISLDLVHQNGRSYKVGMPGQYKSGSKAEIDISDLSLSTGIYLLKVQSTSVTERIKILVTD